ncbi:hypothetical protein KM043_017993 [Ampulex compressa]|nr:hypothetical protein KM043_017993 [Ampulex compressa]
MLLLALRKARRSLRHDEDVAGRLPKILAVDAIARKSARAQEINISMMDGKYGRVPGTIQAHYEIQNLSPAVSSSRPDVKSAKRTIMDIMDAWRQWEMKEMLGANWRSRAVHASELSGKITSNSDVSAAAHVPSSSRAGTLRSGLPRLLSSPPPPPAANPGWPALSARVAPQSDVNAMQISSGEDAE